MADQVVRLLRERCHAEPPDELGTGSTDTPQAPVRLRAEPAASPGFGGQPLPSDMEERIRRPGQGQPLPTGLRRRTEAAFGADFGGVRLHTDSGADGLARSLSARAFTHGEDVFFRSGAYDPAHPDGEHTLAHELTHVLQQGAGGQRVQRQDGDEAATESGEGSDTGDNVVQTFDLAQLAPDQFGRWLGQLIGVKHGSGVGSVGTSFRFDVFAGGGMPYVGKAVVGLYVQLAGNLSVQDDRRFRIAGTLGLGATSGIDVLSGLVKLGGEAGLELKLGAAFASPEHFSRYLFAKIGKLVRSVVKGIMKQASQDGKPLGADAFSSLKEKLKQVEKASGPVIGAVSGGATAKVGAELGGSLPVGAEMSVTAGTSFTNFYKKLDGKRYTKRGTTSSVSGEMKLSVPPLTIGGAITYTTVENDANPNNDGRYLNVKVMPGLPLPADFVSTLAAVASDLPDKILTDPRQALTNAVTNMNVPWALIAQAAGAALEGAFAIEWNFVKDGTTPRWTLQYARASSSLSKKLEWQQEFGAYGAVGGLKETLKIERSSGLGEVLGSETLTYVATVYDGLMNRGDQPGELGEKQWRDYTARHRDELVSIGKSIAGGTSPAAEEVMKAGTPEAQALGAACGQLTGIDNSEAWKMLGPRLEAYLAAQRAEAKTKGAATWQQLKAPVVNAVVKVGDNGTVAIDAAPNDDYLEMNGSWDDPAQRMKTLEQAQQNFCRLELVFKGPSKVEHTTRLLNTLRAHNVKTNVRSLFVGGSSQLFSVTLKRPSDILADRILTSLRDGIGGRANSDELKVLAPDASGPGSVAADVKALADTILTTNVKALERASTPKKKGKATV